MANILEILKENLTVITTMNHNDVLSDSELKVLSFLFSGYVSPECITTEKEVNFNNERLMSATGLSLKDVARVITRLENRDLIKVCSDEDFHWIELIVSLDKKVWSSESQ